MKTKCIYRQGDVLIERIDALPPELIKQTPVADRIILAHGEATGHHHSVEAHKADWWKDKNGTQFLTVLEQTEVVHQEHSPIALPVGRYRVRRQREYSPEAIRNVAD